MLGVMHRTGGARRWSGGPLGSEQKVCPFLQGADDSSELEPCLITSTELPELEVLPPHYLRD